VSELNVALSECDPEYHSVVEDETDPDPLWNPHPDVPDSKS